MPHKQNRIWQGLVALYVVLALVASVGALELSYGPSLAAHVPPFAPAVAAAERHRVQPGAIPPSGVESIIPLGRSSLRVPILEYHYVRVVDYRRDVMGYNLSVTPADFKAQMDWLYAHGYHPVTFADLRAYFAGRQPLPARPVVLTFDDGYQNFWTSAEPILLAHGFRSVSYVVPGFWNNAFYMSPQEVQVLDRSGMVEIGSHTMNHADLATAGPSIRAYQLSVSKSVLEQLLGHPVLDFCYPSGKFNAAAAAAVGAAGYQTATTQVPGMALSWAGRLTWPRVRVAGGEKLADFIANLGRPEPAVDILVAPSPQPAPGSGAF